MTKARLGPRWQSFVLLLALCTLPALPAAAQAQLTPFRVGMSDAVNTVLPLWMAQAGGFFAANGLKVELVNTGGGSRGAQELQAGKLDIMRVGLSSVVQANRAGGDLRLVASMSNVIRFTFFSAAGVQHRGRSQGRHRRREQLRLRERLHRHARARTARLTRADVTLKEYGGATQTARRAQVGRDQGDRNQRADHQPRARSRA